MPVNRVERMSIVEYNRSLEQAMNIVCLCAGMGGFESESSTDSQRKAEREYLIFKKEGIL